MTNMVAIKTVTVGAGGAASIDFTNIPQTYTDLQIVLSGRQSVAGGTNVNMKFNSSSSGYTNRDLINAAGTAAVSESTVLGTSSIKIGFIPEVVNYTASTFSNQLVYIPNYAGSNNKSVSTDNVMENNSTSVYFGLFAGLWSNSSAITSIALTCENGNFVQYSTATLYGVTSAAVGAKATGGIITSDANYYYHTFLASGTFTPTANITADYLVVAGGGGGGGCVPNGTHSAGGGGAGGLRSTVTATGGGGSLESAVSLTSSTAYTITIGAGGTGVSDGVGGNGNNSSISGSGLTTITSTAGGGGGGRTTGAGSNGGSGGGASATGGGTTGGTGTANQGYAGGNVSGSDPAGAGGGGAGGAGSSVTSPNGPGTGGAGVAVAISGSSVTYAGGGGGGGNSNVTTGATGGAGGGGAGGNRTGTATGVSGTAGTAYTGSGGGGSPALSGTNTAITGGNGGSGIVIVRYAK